jgi:hypothetical protein
MGNNVSNIIEKLDKPIDSQRKYFENLDKSEQEIIINEFIKKYSNPIIRGFTIRQWVNQLGEFYYYDEYKAICRNPSTIIDLVYKLNRPFIVLEQGGVEHCSHIFNIRFVLGLNDYKEKQI